MIKSKLKSGFVSWFITMILGTIGLLVLIGLMLYSLLFKKFDVYPMVMSLFLSALFGVVLIIFKDYKRIIINKAAQTIKYYSIYRPFGKSIELKNFIGYIKSVEYGRYETYRTIHLVDKTSKTAFKISGLFYDNFDEMYNAIELKEIKKYRFGFWKYIKLVCTSRIKIETKKA
ncbi:hypothetical protein MQE36_16115 [Zhouia spongiae]|uniref:Uncharacterized protein n=1 Tax=Zhouia spongiae TaxID=2202721 RepID=A0ABY3YL82_9FLAO|nr:hypothetical protein [Zhouia spongiae]UNY98592.1 hypothetical protein MQE36_16115 [Zhouia spongiae]